MGTIVHIITVCFNDLEGLKQTVMSVRNQSDVHVHHIIIDGGSTDGTREWLESNGSGLDWISEKDKGIFDGMNKGLDKAGEGIVTWLNSSDYYDRNDNLKQVVDSYEKRHWQWAYGDLKFHEQGTHRPLNYSKQVPFSMKLLAFGIRWIPHEISFFESRFVKSLGKYELNMGPAADQEFLLRAAIRQTPHYLKDIYVSMESGGTHTRLTGMQREKAWQDFRSKNGQLLFGSKSLDDMILPILPFMGKVNYFLSKRMGKMKVYR